MVKKSGLNSLEELIQHEAILARGDSVGLSLRSDRSSAQAVTAHFLRAFRGRPDFSDVVMATHAKRAGLADQLEKIRNYIYCGDAESAEALLLPLLSEESFGECTLELARIRLLQNRLDESLDALDRSLGVETLSDASRMSCYQLRGDVLIRLGRSKEAVADLKRAISLAETFKVASSAFSAHAFLVKAYVELGDSENAHTALRTLKMQLQTLEELESEELWLDRLLTLIRTEALMHQSSAHIALAEAHAIAQHLGDQATVRRCLNDASPGADFKTLTTDGRKIVNSYNGWSYLPFRELILIRTPKGLVKLDSRPVMQKILMELILCPDGMDKEALFNKVWNLEFDSERHSPHLLATLSKLRKLLPPGALQVSDGKVRLV